MPPFRRLRPVPDRGWAYPSKTADRYGRCVIYTIGHGTKEAGEFVEVLGANGVELLVDVRTAPGSRRHPQFGREALAAELSQAGIGYEWRKDLGGWRKVRPDSPNSALRSAGFRGYADYMATPEFGAALDRLVEEASRSRTCLMCAETLWWRCHRSLLADALTVRGLEVRHILGGSTRPHRLHAALRTVDGRLIYDVEARCAGSS